MIDNVIASKGMKSVAFLGGGTFYPDYSVLRGLPGKVQLQYIINCLAYAFYIYLFAQGPVLKNKGIESFVEFCVGSEYISRQRAVLPELGIDRK